MRRLLLLTLAALMLLSPLSARALSGQSIDTFMQYYEEDITFINENDGRFLLPLVIAKRESDIGDGKYYYELFGDVLSASIRTDTSGEIIEVCSIKLAAPAGMEYGSAVYNDFATSGFHSYALLMAMDTHTQPAERFQLVQDVLAGMSDDGEYRAQLGSYTLLCTRVDGVATLLFENSMVDSGDEPQTVDDILDALETLPPPEDDDAGLG